MNFETDGIVMSQRKSYQENQKFLTILTKHQGLIEAKIRPFGQISKNIYNNVTILGYYHFNLYQGRGIPSINAVEPKELFFDLRYDPKKLALSQYFCELTSLFIQQNQKATKHLSLLLNTLWKLQKEEQNEKLIKSIFEMRLISYSGYMPNLVGCKKCNKYESDKMYYMPLNGILLCEECIDEISKNKAIYLPKTILHTLRFITYKDDKEIFNFKIADNYIEFLSRLSEYCILTITEQKPTTLNVYNQFINKEEQ